MSSLKDKQRRATDPNYISTHGTVTCRLVMVNKCFLHKKKIKTAKKHTEKMCAFSSAMRAERQRNVHLPYHNTMCKKLQALLWLLHQEKNSDKLFKFFANIIVYWLSHHWLPKKANQPSNNIKRTTITARIFLTRTGYSKSIL